MPVCTCTKVHIISSINKNTKKLKLNLQKQHTGCICPYLLCLNHMHLPFYVSTFMCCKKNQGIFKFGLVASQWAKRGRLNGWITKQNKNTHWQSWKMKVSLFKMFNWFSMSLAMFLFTVQLSHNTYQFFRNSFCIYIYLVQNSVRLLKQNYTSSFFTVHKR